MSVGEAFLGVRIRDDLADVAVLSLPNLRAVALGHLIS
jgi:hypothetical protein